MSLDRLLLRLSARREGSWAQFRSCVEDIDDTPESDSNPGTSASEFSSSRASDLPIYQEIRFSLQRLGHVEFFADGADKGWRVVPASLALPSNSAAQGFLCGARTPELLARFNRGPAVASTSPSSGLMPSRITLKAPSIEELLDAAGAAGLCVQRDAPVAILSALPTVKDRSSWVPSAMPTSRGWAAFSFSPATLRWSEVAPRAALSSTSGLFRFVMGHQRFCYLRAHSSTYLLPIQVGKFAVMRRRQGQLAYDGASRVFSTPLACRPPMLVERALALCSGELPRVQNGRAEYAEVPPRVGLLAAQILCQELG